jgi:hypothetical protein
MEKTDRILFVAIIIGVVLLWYFFGRNKTSGFTSQSFDGMTITQATASFTQQTAQIVQELKQKLTDAMMAGNTKEQLIEISDTYSGYSCDLNKAFSRFQINNMDMNALKAPSPA